MLNSIKLVFSNFYAFIFCFDHFLEARAKICKESVGFLESSEINWPHFVGAKIFEQEETSMYVWIQIRNRSTKVAKGGSVTRPHTEGRWGEIIFKCAFLFFCICNFTIFLVCLTYTGTIFWDFLQVHGTAGLGKSSFQ